MNSVYFFIRLALLAFFPDKTKISFDEDNNTITFRKPTMTQGVMRWVYGESRDDILTIKDHILNVMYLLQNANFQKADSIIYCVCKSLNKLKLCYIDTTEIKDLLNLLETQLVEYYNKKGKRNDLCKSGHLVKEEQILGKWTFHDIQFINLNIKCILELEKYDKTEYKDTLKDTYCNIIDEFSTHMNSN
jgi:hypothetical protein